MSSFDNRLDKIEEFLADKASRAILMDELGDFEAARKVCFILTCASRPEATQEMRDTAAAITAILAQKGGLAVSANASP